MKNALMSAITAIALVILASCAPSTAPTSAQALKHRPKPKIVIADLEWNIHRLINKERQTAGLTALVPDDMLSHIARKHSRDMGKRGYFDHYSPEGRDFSYRYQQEGYQCGIVTGTTIHMGAENIALNFLYDTVTTVNGEAFYDWNSSEKIAETTVRGWMKSPGHRQNILTPYFRHEGIGVFVSPEDKVYITQNFC